MTILDSSFMDIEGSCLPYTPEEEQRIITELKEDAEANLKEGNLYYVVSNRWWRDWQEYAGQDETECPIDEHSTSSQQCNGAISKTVQRPGQIDNSDLVLHGIDGKDDQLELHRTLEEGHDYVLVPQEVWKKIFEWYKGGPELPRKMISNGYHHTNFSVEVYPLCLHLINSRDTTKSIIQMSKKTLVRELYNRVRELYKLEQGKVHIWDYFNKRKQAVLSDFDRTLEEAHLQMDQDILLEVEVDGYWPSGFGMDSTGNELALVPIEPSRSSVTIAGGPALSNGYSSVYSTNLIQGNGSTSGLRDVEDEYGFLSTNMKEENGGLTGLQNLGNTCFMNSALQCLVHTPPLVEYFLQDYSDEINKQNPLGMNGELAVSFGELLRKLWSSGRTPIAPRAFKGKLARFAPQFSGYNQHDSQELLAFLLDGLHEDLNRVKLKPYIEAKDANGRPDEEVANECWENHKARNDSVIVDVCQGQYKSTLVCPICSKVSVTFDPFMYLSLPLPSTVMRTMTITVFYGDGSALPMPFTVTVLKHGCCKDLTQALTTACCLKTDESLLLAEVYDHRIYRYLETPHEPLSGIRDDEHIVAYRLPLGHEKLRRYEILHRSMEICSSNLLNNGHRKLLGTPLVTCLPEGNQTGCDIQAAVSTMLAPLLRGKSFLPSNHVKTGKENGSGNGFDLSNYDPCSVPNDSSGSDMELEQISNVDSSFQLSLTDEKCLSRISIENDSLIKPGLDTCTRVMVDWSDREHELYDASYLENLPEVFKSGFMVKKTRQEAITLFSCLEAFLKEEPLGPDDMWYCPTCTEHRQATKKLDLWRLPEILVVHLKRFSYSRFLKNKLDTFVSFPLYNLDLSKYVKHKAATPQSHVYELYAVSNHYGGLGGGHYSAHAKLIEVNRWYHFDDSHVSSVGEEAIKTSAAYVLFYRRVES